MKLVYTELGEALFVLTEKSIEPERTTCPIKLAETNIYLRRSIETDANPADEGCSENVISRFCTYMTLPSIQTWSRGWPNHSHRVGDSRDV